MHVHRNRSVGRWSLIAAAFTALLLALTSMPAASASPATSATSASPAASASPATSTPTSAYASGSVGPYCGITWGSLAKTGIASGYPGTVEDIRAGKQDCFDRLVIDLGSSTDVGFDVRYVSQVVQDGSGLPVSLRGGAFLQILVQANAYDDGGATYSPSNPAEAVSVTGFSTLRQVAWAGSFEGQSTVGIGVRAKLPFRVFLLDGPGAGGRLVIDVAHRW